MTSVAEIERAVERLSSQDLSAFRAWFERFEADRFDRAIEDGAMTGRLDRLADEALAEARSGTLREL